MARLSWPREGLGTPITDPVAYLKGGTATISNVTFISSLPIAANARIRVTTDSSSLQFNDANFFFDGLNGATVPGPLPSQTALPASVANIDATLNFSISFDDGQTWNSAGQARQKIFVTYGTPRGFAGDPAQAIPARPNITAKRLDKVARDFSGLASQTNMPIEPGTP